MLLPETHCTHRATRRSAGSTLRRRGGIASQPDRRCACRASEHTPSMAPRAAAPAPAAAVMVGPPLVTSPEDKRQYRRVVLSNQLVAVLVHDPEMVSATPCTAPDAAMSVDGDEDGDEEEEEEECDEEEEEEDDEEMVAAEEEGEGGDSAHDAAPSKKAAIALAVSVGSFSDPDPAQGLSHFLEVRHTTQCRVSGLDSGQSDSLTHSPPRFTSSRSTWSSWAVRRSRTRMRMTAICSSTEGAATHTRMQSRQCSTATSAQTRCGVRSSASRRSLWLHCVWRAQQTGSCELWSRNSRRRSRATAPG